MITQNRNEFLPQIDGQYVSSKVQFGLSFIDKSGTTRKYNKVEHRFIIGDDILVANERFDLDYNPSGYVNPFKAGQLYSLSLLSFERDGAFLKAQLSHATAYSVKTSKA